MTTPTYQLEYYYIHGNIWRYCAWENDPIEQLYKHLSESSADHRLRRIKQCQ